jgi:uncharacterized protein YfaS (alpha-2-macroglobulin family)
MKKIALFLALTINSFVIMSQEKYANYLKLWENVQQFEKQALPKSALKQVEAIYLQAKSENNVPQIAKTLLFKSKYALILEENAQLLIVNWFKTEINSAQFPLKNILESALANIYWQYFNNNRWTFYNRTQTGVILNDNDFRTWDLPKLFNTINHHFEQSLQNGLLAQQTPLENFNELLLKADNSKLYRPTLYDFLNHNALSFYKTTETSITQPTYKFELENENYLQNAQLFSKLELQSKNTSSLLFNALKIYQNLTRFHLLSGNTTALIAIELERLSFVENNAVFENKEAQYLNALHQLKKDFYTAETSTLVSFEIAKKYVEQAKRFNAKTNTEFQFHNTKAIAICNAAITQFPNSFGAKQCAALKQQIETKQLNISSESYIPINTSGKILVTYKNIESLYFKVFAISDSQKMQFNKLYDALDKTNFLKKIAPKIQFNSQLKTVSDYQYHTSEIVIPPLKNGTYIVTASADKDSLEQNIFASAIIQSTNLALLEHRTNKINTYQLINRNTGKPIEGAQLLIKNFNTNNYNKPIDISLVTNKLGQANFKNNSYRNNVYVTAKTNNETATFGDFYLYKNIDSKHSASEEIRISPFIFTDRSIYRPGQTVFFKGIFVQKQNHNSKIFPNEWVAVTLKDANGQNIKTLHLQTNEFGSVSGEFMLPMSGLTGEYTIMANESDKSKSGFYNKNVDFLDFNITTISVEEYKRPKFEAQFNAITNLYRLNDIITVKGKATAYAGNTVTNAKVVYRVYRKVVYPVWRHWYKPIPYTEEQEIVNGETTTDEFGNFNVSFEAIPDKKVAKNSFPVFQYQINADITDINGETRTANTVVRLAYAAIEAQISAPSKIDKNLKNNSLSVEIRNLNNELVSGKGILTIFKLEAPKKVLRNRPWPSPDFQLIPKTVFEQLFPYEAYQDEDLEINWAKGKVVLKSEITINNISKIELKKTNKWASGKYLAQFETYDNYGEKVTANLQFLVYNANENEVFDNQLFEIFTDKNKYKPNDIVKLKVGSAALNAFATIVVEKNNEVVDTQIITLNNESKIVEVPVLQSDLGGFVIHYSFAHFNSLKVGNLQISVPIEEKKIEIETAVFRDKLQPGQLETWSFTLKGKQSEKVAAEMLATLYDASLDQFKSHIWRFNPIVQPTYYVRNTILGNSSFNIKQFNINNLQNNYSSYPQLQFDQLNWFGFTLNNNRLYMAKNANVFEDDVEIEEEVSEGVPFAVSNQNLGDEIKIGYAEKEEDSKIEIPLISKLNFRKDFNETAFFYPHLQTDSLGNIKFSFTVPEALTLWKLKLLAHTKDLATVSETKFAVTQKELMIVPNAPRFLREGDTLIFSGKISNLSTKTLNGKAQLFLYDALTGEEISEKMKLANAIKYFEVETQGNTAVHWKIYVPKTVQAVQYKMLAVTNEFSDGEQNILPVLSNRMLVTETLPLWVNSNETQTFKLDKLVNTSSATRQNHTLTLEITSNPAWYALQSLPYLMEYPYDCSEQIFSKYYANSLASNILQSNPRIKEVFNQWQSADALLSNLEKNNELKSLIIAETPWIRDAQNESEQKKRIGLLFDLNTMQMQLNASIEQLQLMQFRDGSFPWFKGSNFPNLFVTQHIAAGYGHLKKLNALTSKNEQVEKMMEKAVLFLDNELLKEYNKLLAQAENLKQKEISTKKGEQAYLNYLAKNHLSAIQLHYLYMRSFYQLPKTEQLAQAISYYTAQSATYWTSFNLYEKGLITLIQYRNANPQIVQAILKSLKENSIFNKEIGRYWKENNSGYFWNQSPIETQALLIEVFSETTKDTKFVDELKVWLLKNKQTSSWKTTKETTEAVYALLLQGNNWLSSSQLVDVKVGNTVLDPVEKANQKPEIGTGYFKTTWNNNQIVPNMGLITLTKKDKGIGWGALYWQYFEDLENITSAKTGLSIQKKLFKKINSNKGKQLIEINENSPIKVGDLITSRIEIMVDRSMEFIHLKDMRSSGLEPITVLSEYKWQDGLGYYQSTKDVATHFFIEYLPKGVYVFEYDLRANNAGYFSNGIATIQSMYAPEFSSHSSGIKIEIKP